MPTCRRGAAPEAEAQLMRDLTDILIQHEGLDPRNPRVRDVTWIFVHRPAAVYRAGEPATAPIYRIVPSVPEGQYTDARRAGEGSDRCGSAREGVPADVIGKRVWVFPTEVNDGCWGARGAVRRLPDIMESFGGATLRELGERRLAAKRRVDAGRLIGARWPGRWPEVKTAVRTIARTSRHPEPRDRRGAASVAGARQVFYARPAGRAAAGAGCRTPAGRNPAGRRVVYTLSLWTCWGMQMDPAPTGVESPSVISPP